MTMTNEPAEHDPQPETASRLTFRGGSLAGAIVFSAGLFVGVLSTRGGFDKMFADFGYRELPAITNIARSELFVWLVGTLFGLTIIKELLLKNRNMRAVCNTVAVIAALVLGAFYVFGMFRPLIVLIEKVSP
jgi:uncharacterized membrane protein YdcZ (DUF606 family)